MTSVKPFIRCPGGKTWLTKRIDQYIEPHFDEYHEYFLGGGSMFFHLYRKGLLKDKRVVLNDSDRDLICLYQEIKNNPEKVVSEFNVMLQIGLYEGIEDYFIFKRKEWNQGNHYPSLNLFLRKCAFNGLWRVNQKGEMNSPYRKDPPKFLDISVYKELSQCLAGVELSHRDFKEFKDEAPHDALIYMDPPYLGGFTSYSGPWTPEDAQDVFRLARSLSLHINKVIVSHSDTPDIRLIIDKAWPEARIDVVHAKRSINSDGSKRGEVPELLIYNAP